MVALCCARWRFSWLLTGIFALKERSGIGMGCPGKWKPGGVQNCEVVALRDMDMQEWVGGEFDHLRGLFQPL